MLYGFQFFVNRFNLNEGRKSCIDPDSDAKKLPDRKFNVVMLKNYQYCEPFRPIFTFLSIVFIPCDT
jgi:hypothetical protein